MKKILLFCLSILVLIACNFQNKTEADRMKELNINLLEQQLSNEIKNGNYGVFSYKTTKVALSDSIDLRYMPKFKFYEGNKIKVYSDFSFGYFKDSLFEYEIRENYILLKNENSNFKFEYLNKSDDIYDLFINHKYLKKITIRKI